MSFSDLTLLISCQERHPACKTWVSKSKEVRYYAYPQILQ